MSVQFTARYGSHTVTEEPPPAAAPEPPSLQQIYMQALDDLMGIVTDCTEWRDPLSGKILKWVEETVPHVPPPNGIPTDEEVEVFKIRVTKLVTEILAEPLFNAPLEQPVLVGTQIMEKRLFEDFSVLQQNCAPTQEPYVAREHVFAARIISWVQSLPFSSVTEEASSALTQRNDFLSLPDPLRWAGYVRKAQEVNECSIVNRGICQPIEQCSVKLKKLQQEIDVKIEAERKKLSADIAERNRVIEARITRIEHAHDVENSHLQTQIKHLTEQVATLQQNSVDAHRLIVQLSDAIWKDSRTLLELTNQVCSLREQADDSNCSVM